MKKNYDVIVIGGGPAGLAAAISACNEGAKALIIERDDCLGGILNQCIHNGFGLTRFKESLSGPEYAARFIDEVKKRGIDVFLDTAVLSLTKDKEITVINSREGVFTLRAKSVVLAMGCRERSRGAIHVPGTRPAGVFSAGTAQKYVNIKGYMPGRRVVILGSGDIGLIMARRMTLEGAKVLAVCEIMPYSSGLRRNIEQCLNDFDIPLYLSHTLTKIEGEERVTGVVISKVDEKRQPIAGTEKRFDCDTVLFSVGLIPENELTKDAGIAISPATGGAVVTQTRETDVEGIFACGNVLHVHDLVDFVSEEAEIAGKYAAKYALQGKTKGARLDVTAGEGISYVCPQKIDKSQAGKVKFFFRVKEAKKDVVVKIDCGERTLLERKKKAVTPGEMETITVSLDDLQDESGHLAVRLEAGV